MTQKRETIVANWRKLRKEVQGANKELSDIIDEIDPDDSYKLVKASYLYGDGVVKNGTVHLPNAENHLISLSNSQLDDVVKKELGYHSMPPFLILDKCNEIFIQAGSRVVPINLFNKGWLSGVYEFMDVITEQSFKYN